jgi:phage shock protein PspC (stress-responsive transcriptional regulator)
MNKTVTVNIGGIVFHIDENAYERFRQYLESIRHHFTGSEGRDEIMQDIEARIAEMFQERIKDVKQVITLQDVEEVTTLMGKPEQFGDEGTPGEVAEVIKVKKRLFRNPDDKKLGGVCSGFGAYFDIDPIWIRLLFIIAFFGWGSGLIIYIILWIIMPEANTTAEKLQMKGEAVTVSNIEKEKNVKDTLGRKTDNLLSRIFEALGQLIKFFFKFIGKIIAVFFVFIGLVTLFGLFASMLALFKIPGTQYPEVLNQIFPTHFQFGLAFTGVLLLIGIPFLLLAYAGLRILFNVTKYTRTVGFTALGLWLFGLVICIIMGIRIAGEFSESYTARQTVSIMQPSGKKMILKMEGKDKTPGEKDYDRWDDEHWNGDLRLSNNELLSRNIRMDVVKSPDDSFRLVKILYSRGPSRKEAADLASRLTYSFTQLDSALSFSRSFIIDKGQKFRGQKIQLVLQVPEGGQVYLDKSMRHFIYDIDNEQNIYDSDMMGHTWEMKDELSCIDCTGDERTVGGNFNIEDHDGNVVRIDENGIYIHGEDNETVSIDSTGVMIKKNGKIKHYKKGFHINIDEDSIK